MDVAHDMVAIKLEARELNLHIYFQFGGDGKITAIKQSHNTDVQNSYISSVASMCPDCNSHLNINFFVHDESSSGDAPMLRSEADISADSYCFDSNLLNTVMVKAEPLDITDVKLVDPSTFAVDASQAQQDYGSFYDDMDDPNFRFDEDVTASVAKEFANRKYQCNVCHRRYKDVKSLRKHVRLYHQPESVKVPEGKLYCRCCYKTFINVQELNSHALNHSLACAFCEHVAESTIALQDHLNKNHKDKQPFNTVCTSCGKYVNRSLLVIHLKACKASNYVPQSTANRYLNRTKPPPTKTRSRKNAKQNYKSILCIYCQDVFYNRSDLVQHQSAHSLECKLCETPKLYNSLQSLKKHVRRFHCHQRPDTDDLKNCPICNHKYSKNSFSTHLVKCAKDNKIETEGM